MLLFLYIIIRNALHRYIYRNSLRAGRSGDRIPVEVRFSAPVQTRPGAHPNFYVIDTGFFLGVKQPEHGFDQSPPLSSRLKKE
jgi:hypothetical protein